MNFVQWVDSVGGQAKASTLLGISIQTLHHWYVGRGRPRVTTAFQIVKATRGKVSLEALLNSKQENFKPRRRRK